MSNYTLRITANQKDIDSDNNETNQEDYTISTDFDVRRTFNYIKTTGSTFYAVDMEDISTAVGVRIYSDQVIGIKLNGSSDIIDGLTNLILTGEVTAIQFRNNSGATANITIEVFG